MCVLLSFISFHQWRWHGTESTNMQHRLKQHDSTKWVPCINISIIYSVRKKEPTKLWAFTNFCKEYHEGNAKLLTQQKSASPNHCRYITLRIRHRARATVELLDRETPEFIPPILWPPNSPDLNPLDYSVWGILQGRCTKQAWLISTTSSTA